MFAEIESRKFILEAFAKLKVGQQIKAHKLWYNGQTNIRTGTTLKFNIYELIPNENKILVRNIDTDSQELFYIDISKGYTEIQWSRNDDEKWMIDT